MPEYSSCATCNCYPCACGPEIIHVEGGYAYRPNALCTTCFITPCVCQNDTDTTSDDMCRSCYHIPCVCPGTAIKPLCSNCGAMSCVCHISEGTWLYGTQRFCFDCSSYYYGAVCGCADVPCSECERYKAIIRMLLEDY